MSPRNLILPCFSVYPKNMLMIFTFFSIRKEFLGHFYDFFCEYEIQIMHCWVQNRNRSQLLGNNLTRMKNSGNFRQKRKNMEQERLKHHFMFIIKWFKSSSKRKKYKYKERKHWEKLKSYDFNWKKNAPKYTIKKW